MESFSQISDQLQELQQTLKQQNDFMRECFEKLLSKKKESPKKETPVKKNFSQSYEYYQQCLKDQFKNNPILCTYVAKKNTDEPCCKKASYFLSGTPEQRVAETISEAKIYDSVIEKYGEDAKKSFSKFRCSSCKNKGLKDSLSKCEELIGKKDQTDQVHESASSPKPRSSNTRKTTPSKILSPKESNYIDKIIQLDDGTNLVTRKEKGKRTPVVVIGKLQDNDNEDYINNLVRPSENDIKSSGLKYEEIVPKEQIINSEDEYNKETEDEDDHEQDELSAMVANLT